MDTSKEYILMCEKAVGVQELWKLNSGDFIHNAHSYNVTLTIHDVFNQSTGRFSITGSTDEYPKHWFWLPRQDQLQGMVMDGCFSWSSDMMYRFNSYLYENLRKRVFTSMEQLWLAFVMKEKFNKTWNGKDWK